MIIVTGDVAETASRVEYAIAESFLKELAASINISHDNILVVPGNHDISWATSKRLFRGHPEDSVPSISHMRLRKSFDTFASRLGVITPSPNGKPEIVVKPELSTIFLLIDSTLNETHFSASHYGVAREQDIADAIRQVDSIDEERNLLRIAVCHHNPRAQPLQSDCLRNGDYVMTSLAEAGFSALLHGHIHLADASIVAKLGQRHLAVCSTGRAFAADEESPAWAPRYQTLCLDPSGNVDSFLVMRKWEDIGDRGKWVVDGFGSGNELGVIRFRVTPQSFQDERSYLKPLSAPLDCLTHIGTAGHPLAAR